MKAKVSDSEFIALWQKLGGAAKVAKALGTDEKAVYRRRRNVEKKYDTILKSNHRNSPDFKVYDYSNRSTCTINNGTIVVGSDAHYWPGVISTAHRAFVNFIAKNKPEVVVLNGDLFDGTNVSRHPRTDWTALPSVKEELEAVADRVDEIRKAAGSGKIWWCLGNHDMRFEAKLANTVSEFAGVPGFALKDHFPGIPMAKSLLVNDTLMIKHRYHNGIHATFNNTLKSGLSMCTGHLHRLQATSFSDYRGTRWGIDCGTLGETEGSHMHYGEDNPVNHCSGFAVLTFHDGVLVQPELCAVINDKAYFRGKQIA